MSSKKDRFSSQDKNYMKLAINLARSRKGLTGDNPSVGCLIVKNDEIIFTEGNSKAIDKNNSITASNFKFDKIKNILTAEKNVRFVDEEKKTEILSDKATYIKNDEKIWNQIVKQIREKSLEK